MTAAVPAVVYDCMVYLQAAMSSRGPAARCLEVAEEGRVRLFVSQAVVDEIRDVLGRPKVRRRRSHLTAGFITAFVERIRKVATILDPVPAAFQYARDPDDEPYLNLTLAAQALYLVSRDRDLLDLQHPDSPPGQALRQLIPQPAIVDPVQFLDLVSPTLRSTQ